MKVSHRGTSAEDVLSTLAAGEIPVPLARCANDIVGGPRIDVALLTASQGTFTAVGQAAEERRRPAHATGLGDAPLRLAVPARFNTGAYCAPQATAGRTS